MVYLRLVNGEGILLRGGYELFARNGFADDCGLDKKAKEVKKKPAPAPAPAPKMKGTTGKQTPVSPWICCFGVDPGGGGWARLSIDTCFWV